MRLLQEAAWPWTRGIDRTSGRIWQHHPYRLPRYAFSIPGKTSGRRDNPRTGSNRGMASFYVAGSSDRRFTAGHNIHTGGQEATHPRYLLPVPRHRTGRTVTVYGHRRDCGEDGRRL